MTDENLNPLGVPVSPDPGNTEPEAWTAELSDDELLDVMKRIEDQIAPTLDTEDGTEVWV